MTHENHLYHVIKDPVHGTMQFTDLENRWIKPFIDSPSFQRLRHIKQMGMGDFIFPGSVHTRFSHSLGCCYVASQIGKKIGLTEAERQLVMIACLLHDIGHGPFSHVFEDLFYQKAIRHEAWTPLLLKNYRTEKFFVDYNQLNPKHPLNAEKFNQIERMIMHNAPDNALLADIVSSQLDADRLDYLLRDSHFCGVTYGVFDLHWMLNCMISVQTDAGPRLGITHKGIGVIEHYLLARRLMIKNIYHHRKKLAMEYFLIELLRSLAKDLGNMAAFADIRQTPTGEFLQAVTRFNAEVDHTNIAELSQQFLQAQHKAYQKLCDYDIFALLRRLSSLNQNHTAIRLAKRIQNRLLPIIIDIEPTNISHIQQLVNNFYAAHFEQYAAWQFTLIQSPHHSYDALFDPILVEDSQSRNQPLENLSPLIRSISGYAEQTVFLAIDREISDHPDLRQTLQLCQSS